MIGRRFWLKVCGAAAGLFCLGVGAAIGWGADEVSAHATCRAAPGRGGSWMLLSGNVTNHSDGALTGSLVVMDKQTSDVQFSAPVWSPAHSILQFPMPFIATSARNQY